MNKVSIRKQDLIAIVEREGIKIDQNKMTALRMCSRPKIRTMEVSDFKRVSVQLLGTLWKDLGIQGVVEPYTQVRFVDFLNQYFGDFSLDEVKTAFEFWMIGTLDGFVKKDLNHYGKWSLDFMSQILKGYRSFRSKTTSEVKNLIPEKVTEVSEQEKIEIKKQWMNSLEIYLINAVEKESEFPIHLYTSFVHKSLVDIGVLDSCEVEENLIHRAFAKMMMSRKVDQRVKSQTRSEYEDGSVSSMLQVAAVNMKAKSEITKLIETISVNQIKEKFKSYKSK